MIEITILSIAEFINIIGKNPLTCFNSSLTEYPLVFSIADGFTQEQCLLDPIAIQLIHKFLPDAQMLSTKMAVACSTNSLQRSGVNIYIWFPLATARTQMLLFGFHAT
jgi:hypothetical protein